MKKVNIKEKLNLFSKHWSPKILGEVNDSYIKIFKAKGEFVWHKHDDEDEFFLVIKGELQIKFRENKKVTLKEGEFMIVPKGVEHLPYAEHECHILLFEPKVIINTGDVTSDKTVESLEWL